MEEKNAANGVLFYSSIYIKVILLAISIITGRWIFLLLILLTIGLTAYMMYISSYNLDHLKSVGKWAEETFATYFQKLRELTNKDLKATI